MNGGEVLLEARGLCLRRGRRSLLDGVDFTLRAGERWVLWGANGAGKTSLARVLAGLQEPDSGELRLAPELASPLPLLFQDPDAQLAAATVRDEVALGARGPGEPFVDAADEGPAGRRLAEALASFRLEAFSRRNPHSLSGGEKRRLGLAALSVLESPLLILDEPELHLDDPSWRAVCERLDAWREEGGRCLLEITRAPERVLGADGLAVMSEGRIVAAGAPREIYERLRGGDLPLPRIEQWESEPAPAPEVRQPLPDEEPLLEARALRLNRPGGGEPVLGSVDLELYPGERLLLTGENGSGKSSLLLLLADLADPDAGVLTRGGGLHTGLAFQDPERLCFAETVGEEVAHGLRALDLTDDARDDRVSRALRGLGLDPLRFAARDPFTLSAGELRRLALACVLAPGPDLLILDEPAAALDRAGSELLRVSLERWPGTLLWADCRPPAGFEGFFHRRLELAGGRLREIPIGGDDVEPHA